MFLRFWKVLKDEEFPIEDGLKIRLGYQNTFTCKIIVEKE